MDKKQDRFSSASVRRTPWDDASDKTGLQSMIIDTNHEWYDAKHRDVSYGEVSFLNSVAVNECPFCASADIIKYGHTGDGVSRFRCKKCHRRFTSISGTIFDSRKIPLTEWVEYLLCLFQFQSITTAAMDNKNAFSTGRYWIRKVFAVLEGIQNDVVLSGTVYFDETFISVVESKKKKHNGKCLRGISRNLMCIAVATDGDKLYIRYEGVSKPSSRSTMLSMKGHISQGSTIIHDGDHSHCSLVKELGLKEEVHKAWGAKPGKKESDPLEKINSVHSLFKSFLSSHSGFSRDDIDGWTDLFWFIWSRPNDRLSKVERFVNMAVNSKKILRYRDFASKKRR